QIRAETLAARGLAQCIHPKDLTGPGLAEALEWALRCDRQAHARLVAQIIPSFDGATRLTAYLSRWLGGDRCASGSSPRRRNAPRCPPSWLVPSNRGQRPRSS